MHLQNISIQRNHGKFVKRRHCAYFAEVQLFYLIFLINFIFVMPTNAYAIPQKLTHPQIFQLTQQHL